MALYRVGLDIDGDRSVVAYLIGVEEHARNARPVFRVIGDDMRRYERELFDSQGATGGRPWASDKPATLEAKARLRATAGASRRIRLDPRVNHATRRMRKSLTRGGPDNIRRVTRDSVTHGTQVPYAKYAQRGTRHAEARPPVVFSRPQTREMRDKIRDWIMRGAL